MTDSTNIPYLIDRYLAGSLTDSEVVQLQRLLIEDPQAAEALALACELEMFLEEHFQEEVATRSQAAALITASLGEAATASPGWFSAWSRSFVVVIVGLVACLTVMLLWHDAGVPPVSAATELNRIIAISSAPQDRTYQITVDDEVISPPSQSAGPPRRKRPPPHLGPPPPHMGPPPGEMRPPPHGMGPPPGGGHPRPPLNGAILHVRGGRQFVLIRATPDGHSFVTGCNGQVSWSVRPDGPVEVSTDLRRFSRGVPGTHHSVPMINIQDGLEGLQSDYDIQISPVENPAEGSGGVALKLLTATRRDPTHMGAARVEITYEDRSGLIQRMQFVEMPQSHQAPITMLLTFVEARNLAPKFFDHESHHEPGRRIESVH